MANNPRSRTLPRPGDKKIVLFSSIRRIYFNSFFIREVKMLKKRQSLWFSGRKTFYCPGEPLRRPERQGS